MPPGLPDAMAPQGALFTDLYELRMARAYLVLGMLEEAVFSLFVRRLPDTRNDLLAECKRHGQGTGSGLTAPCRGLRAGAREGPS
ncbi:hypothetical protein QMO56_15960 [Roseomonas sp. E05]|uniref:hypothetical protein n=1 Tax=Roseomonas sp. E05 TaxID=3046310 RepID=UPI0024B928C7|nr:hypothetical protein [Roseomonas sp. E05]MDJ0389612.1 hypothetical protein [Roseomonas sp. E05]